MKTNKEKEKKRTIEKNIIITKTYINRKVKEKECGEKIYNYKNIHQPLTKVLHITKTCGDIVHIKNLQKIKIKIHLA